MGKAKVNNELVTGKPVETFPMEFQWYSAWEPVFDRQVETIRDDIQRARSNDRLVAYLSCPISSKGGGFSDTNVEISEFTELRLREEFGMNIWILNPTSYQLESKVGRELIQQAAKLCHLKFDDLPEPRGGDYMRMWTKVLVDDGNENRGDYFDIEEYFARKLSGDQEFHSHFTPPFYDDEGNPIPEKKEKEEWKKRRGDFVRFYGLRASATYSKGCHDEWNIWVILNRLRLNERAVGSQIVGYFDGSQLDAQSFEREISKGYAL
jgi:hypothetical protein